MIKRYSQLILLPTFQERLAYLRTNSGVGIETFGFDRYLNQVFYQSSQWRKVRDAVIIRDNGCDLGIQDRQIFNRIYIHHMNPVKVEDITGANMDILDPQYLITTSFDTHQAIHYGVNKTIQLPTQRKPGDTLLWKKNERS